jgi:signal recognition particle subunit SRP54
MLVQMRRLKKMGSFTEILGMIPGANRLVPDASQVDEGELARVEAIISSMTERERQRPKLLNASRRKRIARGSGTTVQDVNRLMKNYEQMRKMMKSMGKRPPRGGSRPGL